MSPSPIDALLASAPELINSPSLASDAVASGPADPGGTGQVLSHANVATTVAQQGQKHQGILGAIGSFFSDDILHPIEQAGGDALNLLAQPIGDVQHNYRYFHDVVDKHGAFAGFASLIPAIIGGTVGGAAGFFGGGPIGMVEGAKLGSEGALDVSRRILFADSNRRTAPGDYRDSHGALVNPGQDFMDVADNVLNGHDYHPNSGVDLPSGTANAVFDLFLDPLMIAGKVHQASNLLKYGVDGADATVQAGIQANKDGRAAVAAALASGHDASAITVPADRVTEIFDTQPKVAAMAQILAKSSTEDILTKFPSLSPLAPELGKAQNVDDVANVFRDAVTAKNGSVLSRGLPTTALTRIPAQIALARNAILNAGSKDALAFEYGKDAAGEIDKTKIVPSIDPVTGEQKKLYILDNAGNPVLDAAGQPRIAEKSNPFIRVFTSYRAFNISDDLTKFSSHEADPTDASFGDTLYAVAKQHLNARTANAYRAQFMESDSPAAKYNLVTNAFVNTLRALGLPDEHPSVQKYTSDVSSMLDATGRPVYGLDDHGLPITVPLAGADAEEGTGRNIGLLKNQTGKIALPNYKEIRGLQRDMRSNDIFGPIINTFGKADDWVNAQYTTKIFKSLALLSLGFAFRVATGEIVPATLAKGHAIASGSLGLAMEALNPSVRHLIGDEGLSLVGKSAQGADGLTGTIVSHSADGSRVTLEHAPSEAAVAAAKVDVAARQAKGIPLERWDEEGHMSYDPAERPQGTYWSATDSPGYVSRHKFIGPKNTQAVGSRQGNVAVQQVEIKHPVRFDSKYQRLAAKDTGNADTTISYLHSVTAPDEFARLSNLSKPDMVAELKQTFPGRDWDKFAEHKLTDSYDLLSAYGAETARAKGAKSLLMRGDPTIAGSDEFVALHPDAMVRNTPVLKPTESTHRAEDLTLNHDDISTYDLRKLAKEQGFDFDGGDFKHLRAATRAAIYGSARPLVDKTAMESAQLVQMNLNGHRLIGPLAADHGERVITDGQSVLRNFQKAGQLAGDKVKLGTKFDTYDGQSQYHSMFWNFALHEAAKDEGLVAGAAGYQRVLARGGTRAEALDAHVLEDMRVMRADPATYQNKMAGADDLRQYAIARGKLLQGLVSHPGGTGTHMGVLDDLANGKASSYRDLDAVGIENRPKVKGRSLDPASIDTNGGSLLNTIVQGGYKRMIDPIINNMSRKPIFNALVADEYKQFQGAIDAGVMTKQQANMVAIQRAVPKMTPLVHNTELRSQASELARNFMPFYFAQEQAYKRYARAAFTDPVAFERTRLMLHGLNDSGIIQQDGAGQGFVTLPVVGRTGDFITRGAGLLGIGVNGGIPSQITGNVASLKSVVPEANLPGMSPLVSIALKEIANVFPSTEPFLSPVIGPIAANEDAYQMLIPNATLKAAINATPLGERTKSFHSAFLYAIQNAARRADELRGQAATAGLNTPEGMSLLHQADQYLPGADNQNPHLRQQAVDRIKTTTRLLFVVKAAFNLTSPLSPRLDVGDIGLRKEFSDTIKKNHGDMALGVQAFLDKHPDATADTVFQSDSKFTNVNIPSGNAALAFTTDNRNFVQGHPLAAAYLMPQDGTATNLEAYNQQVALGLRQRRTPDQFLDAVYAASTNARYYPALKAKLAMTQGMDPYQARQVNSSFAGFTNALAAANPVWYSQLKDPRASETAHFALQDLRQTIANGSAPASPQLAGIQSLMNAYDSFASQEAQLKSVGQSSSKLNTYWSDYLTAYADSNPQATAVVNGIFRKLPKYEYAVGQA